jgi:hypothetical protein
MWASSADRRKRLSIGAMDVPAAALAPRRPNARFGAPLALCVAIVLAASANEARAATLGSLVTSIGFFAALVAVFVIKGWPVLLPASALSTAGGALVVAGGAVWLWRARVAGRWTDRSAELGLPEMGRARAADHHPRPRHVPLPRGIDREALLVELRLHFVRLQEAWDLGAMATLRTLTTGEMLGELCLGLRGSAAEAGAARTDIVTLRADLFAFEELAEAFVVSIEFSGLMRESPGRCAEPFRELWMLTRSKDCNSGWRLARHQTLL